MAAGGWACSSGSQFDSGSAKGGSSGSGDQLGGKTGNGGSGSGADTGTTGGDGSGTTGGDGNGAAGDNGSGTTGGSSSSGGASSQGGTGTAGTTSGTTACNNGKDDDNDGLIDGFDPECTGPFDNDEGSFATGIPGDNSDPKWQDCFFDGNSGAGDDGCRYATGCLTGELPQTHPDCKLSAACIKYCARLTQNGCDCFGCCTVGLPDGSSLDIHEISTCSLTNIDDEKACPRCTKSTQCGNDCGECELCPGKTLEDLPAKCTPTGTGGASSGGASNGGASNGGTSSGGRANGGAGGTTSTGGTAGTAGTGGVVQTCDGGEQVCGNGQPGCPSSYYCSLGCCIPIIR